MSTDKVKLEINGTEYKLEETEYPIIGDLVVFHFKGKPYLAKAIPKQLSVSKDKGWEIVSFKFRGEIIYRDAERGTFNNATEETFLNYPVNSVKSGDAEIYSVKRLSDNEVFSVSDIISIEVESEYKDEFPLRYKNCIIKGFKIRGDKLHAYGENGMKEPFMWNILGIKKQNKILFTTHDGVAVYEGQYFWLIYTANGIGLPSKTIARKELLPFQSYQKTYSTEEAATEFIINYKHCISVEDVMFNLRLHYATGDYKLSHGEIISLMKKIAKSKL